MTAAASKQPIEQTLLEQLESTRQQLDLLRDQIAESQRLATIGTIAAVIAHEFNNLLTPIVSYSQFALQSAQSDQPDMDLVRKALTKAFQSSTKAGRICQSMLSLARGQSSLGSVGVQELVDETLVVLARDPQKDGIALRVHIEPDLQVQGDVVQLEQVLLNLLINARQAMLGRGGSLTIKACAPRSKPKPASRLLIPARALLKKTCPAFLNPFSRPRALPRRVKPREPAWVWPWCAKSWSTILAALKSSLKWVGEPPSASICL